MNFEDTNICDSCGERIDKSKEIYLNTPNGNRLCAFCATDLLQILINEEPEVNKAVMKKLKV